MQLKTKMLAFVVFSILVLTIFNSIFVSAAGSGNLKRIDIIHKVNPILEKKSSVACYDLLGFKADKELNFVLNSNNSGLDENFVKLSLQNSMQAWDKNTGAKLFNNSFALDYGIVSGPDLLNSISFTNMGFNGILAYTTVMVYSDTGILADGDIVFNTAYSYGDAFSNSYVYDFESILTHEIGHVIGLGDLYSTTCNKMTMYGYSPQGDISKRTLERDDIKGLRLIY